MSACQVIALYVFGHVLGDFYFQPNELTKRKNKSIGYLVLHCVIYAATMYLLSIFIVGPIEALIVAIVFLATHILIDFMKTKWDKAKGPSLGSFSLDQMAHIAICVAVSLVVWHGHLQIMEGLESICRGNRTLVSQSFEVIFTLLAVCRPCSIFIKLLFKKMGKSGVEDKQEQEEAGVGKIIGYFERIIVAILTLWDQYTAIAFVLTAKSIARFRLLEEKNFAEHYLVGTLASTAIAILVSLGIKALVAG